MAGEGKQRAGAVLLTRRRGNRVCKGETLSFVVSVRGQIFFSFVEYRLRDTYILYETTWVEGKMVQKC